PEIKLPVVYLHNTTDDRDAIDLKHVAAKISAVRHIHDRRLMAMPGPGKTAMGNTVGCGGVASSRVDPDRDRIRILTATTLYPNAAQLSHGVFVENRIRHLVATGVVDLQVIAPVPWFPFSNVAFGRYGRYAAAPRTEVRHGISVRHPRYLVIPKIGM